MARLSQEALLEIAKEKNLEIIDIDNYVNLQSELIFKCGKCNKKIISNMESVRHVN